jgi:hypothetical protein
LREAINIAVYLKNRSPTRCLDKVTPFEALYGSKPAVHNLKVFSVIHQVAQAGFPEEPPKDEQAVLIHAEFSDSAGPEKAPFPVFPLL